MKKPTKRKPTNTRPVPAPPCNVAISNCHFTTHPSHPVLEALAKAIEANARAIEAVASKATGGDAAGLRLENIGNAR